MTFGEDMTFFEGRMEVLMEQIRNALGENAEELAKINETLEILASCVEDGEFKIRNLNPPDKI